MTPEQIELGKRAVACKGFRWMPGMRAMPTEGMVTVPLRLDDPDWPHDLGLRVPDLTDPATGGCMLSLLGNSRWMVTLTPEGFVVGTGRCDVLLVHARVGTLGEACAHALTLFPRKRSGVGGRP